MTIFLIFISLFYFISEVFSSPIQPVRTNTFKINSTVDIFLQNKCDLSLLPVDNEFLSGVVETCNAYDFRPYPQNSYALKHDFLMCVGVIDGISKLCSVSTNIKQNLNITVRNVSDDCNKSKDLFTNSEFKHEKNDEAQKWLLELQSVMSNSTECKELCARGSVTNSFCVGMILFNEAFMSIRDVSKIHIDSNTVSNTVNSNGPQSTEGRIEINKTKLATSPLEVLASQSNISGKSSTKPVDAVSKDLAPNDAQIPPAAASDENKQPEEAPKRVEPIDGTFSQETIKEDQGVFQISTKQTDDKILSETSDAFDSTGSAKEDQVLEDSGSEGTIVQRPKEYTKEKFEMEEDSNFFPYFLFMVVLSVFGYVAFHNKNKIIALLIEGRRTRSRSRGRHSSTSYSKLHSNLEETISSNSSAPSAPHILY